MGYAFVAQLKHICLDAASLGEHTPILARLVGRQLVVGRVLVYLRNERVTAASAMFVHNSFNE